MMDEIKIRQLWNTEIESRETVFHALMVRIALKAIPEFINLEHPWELEVDPIIIVDTSMTWLKWIEIHARVRQ